MASKQDLLKVLENKYQQKRDDLRKVKNPFTHKITIREKFLISKLNQKITQINGIKIKFIQTSYSTIRDGEHLKQFYIKFEDENLKKLRKSSEEFEEKQSHNTLYEKKRSIENKILLHGASEELIKLIDEL